MAPITIHGNTIDPDAGPDGTPSPYTSRDAERTNYIYVQGHHLLNNDEKRRLRDLDAHVLAFEGNHTYLCRYPPSSLEPLRELPFVRHANVSNLQVPECQLLANLLSVTIRRITNDSRRQQASNRSCSPMTELR